MKILSLFRKAPRGKPRTSATEPRFNGHGDANGATYDPRHNDYGNAEPETGEGLRTAFNVQKTDGAR